MEIARKLLFFTLLHMISFSFQRSINIDDENEVVEVRPEQFIPYDALEAFYYQTYGDVETPDFGHPNHGRRGHATREDSCEIITAVPEDLRDPRFMRPHGLSSFYEKYTEAYGIPVVGSATVSDDAMRRACYVLRFLLADRGDLREKFYAKYGRVGVLATGEVLTEIPEYSNFLGEEYNKATGGLGAINVAPISTAKQNNLLCYQNDSYMAEDILLREIAEGIFHLAAKELHPHLVDELERYYDHAMASNKWQNTYAEYTKEAYFGEAVQTFFGGNGYASPPDGYHNAVNTRAKLMAYDPHLFLFVQRMFPCANSYIKRCNSRGNEAYQNLRMDCQQGLWDSRFRRN